MQLEITSSVIESLQITSFAPLRILALNGCGLKSWVSFSLLVPFLTNLEELYLSSNTFPDMPLFKNEDEESRPDTEDESSDVFFPCLKVLDISGCGVTDWRQVLVFGSLQKLEDLRVDDNPLKQILPCPSTSPFLFPGLIRMSMSSTKISSWSCVDAVGSYPN
jgi:Leucine-rich repeat (LRR) protein